MELTQRLKVFLGEDWSVVAQKMRAVLQSDIRLLNEANGSILAHNGKMLRPAMTLLMAHACRGTVTEEVRKVAAAAELLHNATLLHDDVADHSDERRGFPTASSVYGDRAAVLLGDYWLVKAMDLILAAGPIGNEVIRIFAKTLSDLAEGEMLQLEKAVRGDTSQADYLRIIYSKTASLFEASCLSGAVCAEASEAQREAARAFGTQIGMAFQIRDDILDYTATDALGKPTGMDLREKKITLPLIGALLQVSDERGRLVRQKVCGIDAHPEDCRQIREFVLQAGGIAYAESVQASYIARAKEALKAFPQGEAVTLLSELADYIGDRQV